MPAAPEASASQPADLDVAADQAIAACGGDAKEAATIIYFGRPKLIGC
jgi:hypothetical protein